jgi:hypothetical protein
MLVEVVAGWFLVRLGRCRKSVRRGLMWSVIVVAVVAVAVASVAFMLRSEKWNKYGRLGGRHEVGSAPY